MYEENLQPLPPGDTTQVFADVLAAIRAKQRAAATGHISADQVLQWADTHIQTLVRQACRRLLLPGSGLQGIEHLEELNRLAQQGHACLLCLNHRSNADVPTLCTLLQDHARPELFDRIIWVAGRKLEEDVGLTPLLVQGFNRIIVTPKSWMKDASSVEQSHAARQWNLAAHRAIHHLRGQGWIFGLFPAGTRTRPDDDSTRQAQEEVDSYLKYFDYLQVAFIDGCILPVAREQDLTHETPQLDRMRYLFGPVQRTQEWRQRAAHRFADLNQREASAQAIIEEIHALPSRVDQAPRSPRRQARAEGDA